MGVNLNPVVTANASANAVCAGNSVTLTGGGANTYVWNNGVTDGVSFVPASANIYTVTGTDGNQCSATATVSVGVNLNPVVTANASASAVCAGNSVTLTGGGANTYVWNNDVADGVSFVPASANTYTVTGTDGNQCSATATVSVGVNLNPVVTANASASAVCAGNSVTLTGGGANTYVWNNGVTDGVSFVPASANIYTVTGTDGNQCSATATVSVGVNLNPVVTANTSASAVCAGNSVTLTGGGANTYVWNNGVTDDVSFAPASANIYTVTGTDGNQCSATATVSVGVNANPIAGITGTAASCGPVSLTANGGVTYLWSGGSSPNTAINSFNSSGLYSVTVSNSYLCSATASQYVTVYPNLSATISGGTSPICYNTSPGTFTANGGGGTGSYTYLWYLNNVSTGIDTQTYNPGALTANAAIYCAVTSASCGTVNTSTTGITVDENLSATISGGTSPICYNTSPGTFTANGGGGTGSYTYLWYKNNASTGITTPTYTPGALTANTSIYCAITSGACGTVNSAATTITVGASLTATISGGTSPICYNTSPGTYTATGLGGNGSYTYLWYLNGASTGVTGKTYMPVLTANASIYCAVTSGTCGTVNTTASPVTVEADLSAAISGGASPICYNSAPGTYLVTPGGGLGSTTYSDVVNFTGTSNGSGPVGTLIQASNGNFYGMTDSGGVNNDGVIFSYNISTGVYTKLLDFNGTGNGANPRRDLFQASNGLLYGMTQFGGVHNDGVMFSYNISTNTYTKLIDFSGAANGAVPYGNLMQASNGLLYGMTENGGVNNDGVIFSYNPATSTYTKLLDFNGANGTANGAYPHGTLVQATNGLLYGMTNAGGVNNEGVIFSYNTSTSTYSKLVDFSGTGGTHIGNGPLGDLLQASNGNLYGMTSEGGVNNDGVIFSYNIAGSAYTKLLDFNGVADGKYPHGGFIQPANGNLYGVTDSGGVNNDGVIFSYNPSTGAFFKLFDFSSSTGQNPSNSNLTLASNGTIYGMTEYGGANNDGVIFSVNPTNPYKYSWYVNGVATGDTMATYTPGTLTGSATITCTITSGSCGTVTATRAVTVDPALTASISGGVSPVCYNTSPGTFTATGSGGAGTYTYLW